MEASNQTFNLGEIFNKINLFIKFYLSSIRLILLCLFACLLFSAFYYVYEKPEYQADTTFVLTESGGSKGGGLASLTSQFGIDLGGLGGSSSMFSGENIFDIFKTKIIVEKVLLTKYNENSNKTLADVYLEKFYKRRFLKFLQINNNISFENYNLNSNSDRMKDSILDMTYNQIITNNIKIDKLNKKGSIIKLSVISRDEQFSKIFTERLLEEVKKLYIKIKNSNTQENINKLQFKADSLETILSNKSFQTANSQVININPAIRKIGVPAELKQKDLTIVMTIYGEVIKNLELSKMTLAQQTPIFQVLDVPRYPLLNNKTKLKNIVFYALIMGFVISLVLSIVKFFLK